MAARGCPALALPVLWWVAADCWTHRPPLEPSDTRCALNWVPGHLAQPRAGPGRPSTGPHPGPNQRGGGLGQPFPPAKQNQKRSASLAHPRRPLGPMLKVDRVVLSGAQDALVELAPDTAEAGAPRQPSPPLRTPQPSPFPPTP